MSAFLGKAGKKLFAKHLEQYAPVDPLYEYYTNDRGKQKRRKRDLPPGLSSRDAAILRSVKKRAHYLDKGFSFCGLRFGWTFIIGIIPIVGDVADITLNYLLVVRKAQGADLPAWLLRRMLVNNAVSAAVGFVPVAGDVILATFKANSRNAALLEEFLRIRGEEFLHMGGALEDAKKGKKGSKAKDHGLTANDVAQVKPGAGMTGSEFQDVIVQDDVGTSTALSDPKPKKKSPSRSSNFGFFGSRSKKTPVDAQGRFVENLESSGSG